MEKVDSIRCQIHKDSYVFGLVHRQNQTKLICDDCLVQIQIKNPNEIISEITLIDQALSEPMYFIKKSIQEEDSQVFDQSDDKFLEKLQQIKQQFQKQISELNQQIKNIEVEFTIYYQKIFEKIDQMKQTSQNTDQYQKFKQCLEQLAEGEDNSNLVKRFESETHKLFSEIKLNENRQKMMEKIQECQIKSYETLNVKLTQVNSIGKMIVKLEKIQKELLQSVQHQFSIAFLTPSIYCYSTFAQTQVFAKFKDQKIDLIYLGSRDGLNYSKFREKCQGKSNLLMVFKSSNGYIFGFYCPWYWNQDINSQINYEQYNKSFLFSENHQQIFQFKNHWLLIKSYYKNLQKNFLDNYSQYIAYFGQDLIIHSDFKAGYSKLGHCYECQGFDGSIETDYLFGQKTPNVVDCEVFLIN